jgi:hypothetical protein
MKLRLMLTAAIALLLVADMATAKEPRDVRPYAHETMQADADETMQGDAHATMQDNANASAQSGTDMSYGGVRDISSASGSARTRTCATRPQCDIFFGH